MHKLIFPGMTVVFLIMFLWSGYDAQSFVVGACLEYGIFTCISFFISCLAFKYAS